MKVKRQRIKERIEKIYACGAKADGTFTRMAFSKEDQAGRELFSSWAKEVGMTVRQDAAGNLILRQEGSRKDAPVLMMGSHLDTVPDGGKYDGVVGCLGALEVCECLKEAGKKLMHPIEIVVFADEEGFRFNKGLVGSMAICGENPGISAEDLDIYGDKRGEIYQTFGLDPAKVMEAERKPEDIASFIELHVEQGASLDQEKIPFGVVSSIAGVDRYEIEITGEANHAGSTKMADRKDALVAAAGMIGRLPEVVKTFGNEYTVATVGTIQVWPHSVNVIPGGCVFNLEIRDQENAVMQTIYKEAVKVLEESCKAQKCSVKVREISHHDPAPMNEQLKAVIMEAADDLGLPYKVLPSGAFHDALVMSERFPTAMLFVPSVNGISHSRYEYTNEEDIACGCQVLLETVLKLDQRV